MDRARSRTPALRPSALLCGQIAAYWCLPRCSSRIEGHVGAIGYILLDSQGYLADWYQPTWALRMADRTDRTRCNRMDENTLVAEQHLVFLDGPRLSSLRNPDGPFYDQFVYRNVDMYVDDSGLLVGRRHVGDMVSRWKPLLSDLVPSADFNNTPGFTYSQQTSFLLMSRGLWLVEPKGSTLEIRKLIYSGQGCGAAGAADVPV